MDTTLGELVIVFLIGLFFSGVFSMLEAAVISQDRHRLLHRASEGDKNAVLMRLLLRRTDRLLSALLLCNNFANVSCAASATAIATLLLDNSESILIGVTFVVTFIILVFSEITPKVLGVRHANKIALLCAPTLKRLVFILSPIIMVTNLFSNCILWIFRMRSSKNITAPAFNLKEIRTALRAARKGNNKEIENHYLMVDKTLLFNEMAVEKIMTPRPQIRGINLTSEIDVVTQFKYATFSKMPLFDGNIDTTIGFVETVQALKLLTNSQLSIKVLKQIASPVLYVPAASSAFKQLQNMRENRQSLALVTDGSGRVIGMLTFTNFATAIIGEETPSKNLSHNDSGGIIAPADTPLFKLEHFDKRFHLPEVNATTLNGMILDYFGEFPKHPICFCIQNWRIEISDFDKNDSIRRVQIWPIQETVL